MTLTTDSTERRGSDALRDIKEAEKLINAGNTKTSSQDAKLEEVLKSLVPDPFAHYQCAFEFDADLSEPVHIPRTKRALRAAIVEEVLAVIHIQGGLQSYCREISSGKHEFSDEFLEGENESTKTAIGQLNNVKDHLKSVLEEIEATGEEESDVDDTLRAAYSHAVPWIRSYRQVAVHNHVFYKINYVLCVGY